MNKNANRIRQSTLIEIDLVPCDASRTVKWVHWFNDSLRILRVSSLLSRSVLPLFLWLLLFVLTVLSRICWLQINRDYTFLDYILGGCQLMFTVSRTLICLFSSLWNDVIMGYKFLHASLWNGWKTFRISISISQGYSGSQSFTYRKGKVGEGGGTERQKKKMRGVEKRDDVLWTVKMWVIFLECEDRRTEKGRVEDTNKMCFEVMNI